MSGSMTLFIVTHYTGDEMKGLKWVEHVARMGVRRNTWGFWWVKLQERDNCEDLAIGGG
jgi:hypothetical protein